MASKAQEALAKVKAEKEAEGSGDVTHAEGTNVERGEGVTHVEVTDAKGEVELSEQTKAEQAAGKAAAAAAAAAYEAAQKAAKEEEEGKNEDEATS